MGNHFLRRFACLFLSSALAGASVVPAFAASNTAIATPADATPSDADDDDFSYIDDGMSDDGMSYTDDNGTVWSWDELTETWTATDSVFYGTMTATAVDDISDIFKFLYIPLDNIVGPWSYYSGVSSDELKRDYAISIPQYMQLMFYRMYNDISASYATSIAYDYVYLLLPNVDSDSSVSLGQIGFRSARYPMRFYVRYLSYDTENEMLDVSSTRYYCGFAGAFDRFLYSFTYSIAAFFNAFRAWYYPLSTDTDLYWRYWNTDTSAEENINLAGLLYNISWYLGNLYLLNTDQNAGADGSAMADAVDKFADAATGLDSAQSAITDIASGNLNWSDDWSLPSLSSYSLANSASWVRDRLADVYSGLGVFALPITVSFVLAIVMQFVVLKRRI